MYYPAHRGHERGSSLIVSLIFLVVIGLVGLASMGTARMELRMSSNLEAKATAMQSAQALMDAIIATPAMTPVIGTPGYTLCTPGLAGCDQNTLYMPAGKLAPLIGAGGLSGRTTAMAPSNGPPPRGLGFSADKFAASAFQIAVAFDQSTAGFGAAGVTGGLVILTPIY